MIMAIDTDAMLYLFESTNQALKYIEAIDIENDEYKFCDDSGQEYIAEIVKPVTAFRSGTFKLISTGKIDKGIPLSFATRAQEIESTCKEISCLADLRVFLEQI